MSAETEQHNDSQVGLLTDGGDTAEEVKKAGAEDTGQQQIELLDVTEEEMNKKGFRIWFKSPKRKSHKDDKPPAEGGDKTDEGGEKDTEKSGEKGGEEKEEFEEVKLVETDLNEEKPEAKKEKKEKKEKKSWFQKHKDKHHGEIGGDGKAVSAELNGSHSGGDGGGGEAQSPPMTYQINLLDRDDRRINDVVKIDFEDVLGEPDGSHSVDCSWKVAHWLFTTTKLWIYRILTLFMSIPAALLCGAGFAFVTLLHVWLLQPVLKLVSVVGYWFNQAVSIFLNAFCTPLFISCSHLFSNIRINHTGTLNRIHEA